MEHSSKALWRLAGISTVYIVAVLTFAIIENGTGNDCVGGYFPCLEPNELGDFLAGLFAPLAFLWLAYTVLMQSSELQMQREELALTRREMEESRKVAQATGEQVQAQANAMKAQTEMLTWQFEEQKRRANDDEISRMISALHQIVLVRVVGEPMLLDADKKEWIKLIHPREISDIDPATAPSVALGKMFKHILERARQYVAAPVSPDAPLKGKRKETMEAIRDITQWIEDHLSQASTSKSMEVNAARVSEYKEVANGILEHSNKCFIAETARTLSRRRQEPQTPD